MRWFGTCTDIHDAKEALTELKIEKQLREQFVATLTHDLKTPITAAKLSSQLIFRKAAGQEPIEILAIRSTQALDRANDMIQGLLDANLIRAGEKLPLDLSEFNLTQLVSDTLDELRTLHGDRIHLDAVGEIIGIWSRSGLRRIVENLVNNAVKYGARDRPIRIFLSKNDLVRLNVHNEGVPIPKEDQSKLFQPFSRVHANNAQDPKGWGLGLTLVKGITESHGGKVELKSDIMSGTTFSILLPIDSRPSARNKILIKNQRILLVEDDPSIRQTLGEFLEMLKLNYVSAANGEEATEILRKNKIDVLITDFQMPKMDGAMLLNWCRNNDYHFPVIFITASMELVDREQIALKDCCASLIRKPINLPHLKKALEAALLRDHHEDCIHSKAKS